MVLVKGICSTEVPRSVADPGLQIKGEGGGGGSQPHPEILDFWSKDKGGPGPPGSFPRSTTAIERGVFAIAMIYHVGNYCAKKV